MDDAETAKARLREFAKQLRRLEFPSSPIQIELAEYFAHAIERYLDEIRHYDEKNKDPAPKGKIKPERPTMDRALGLAKRGRPLDSTQRKELARKIYDMRGDGLSWKEIADELSRADQRTLQRYYDEFEATFLLEDHPVDMDELIRMINDDGKGRNSG